MRKITAELEELLMSKVAGKVILDLVVRSMYMDMICLYYGMCSTAVKGNSLVSFADIGDVGVRFIDN